MKAIEISHNGRVVCRAGLPANGNLSAILNLIATPKEKRKGKTWLASFSAGGLSVEDDDYRFLKFFSKEMREKDQISLRIVEVERSSRPKSQRIETFAARMEAKRNYLKRLTKELKDQL